MLVNRYACNRHPHIIKYEIYSPFFQTDLQVLLYQMYRYYDKFITDETWIEKCIRNLLFVDTRLIVVFW